MNYLNLETRILHSPEFIGCEPVHQATWLKLMLYCAYQENGGVIENCGPWKCRQWQQTCGVMLDEVSAECELWEREGGNVTVWGYPAEIQDKVIEKRHRAKVNGAKGGRPQITQKEPISVSISEPISEPISESEKERKEKERKEKEALSQRENAETAAVSEGVIHEFSDSIPTGNVPTMQALCKMVCSLRSGWARTALTYAEQQSILKNAGSLQSITSSDWQAIRDYLRATIPEGRPAWQPRTRSKFIETAPDVLNYALEWQKKKAPTPSIAEVFAIKPRAVIDRSELAEVFGKASA